MTGISPLTLSQETRRHGAGRTQRRAALVAVAGAAAAFAGPASQAQVTVDPECWPFVVEIWHQGAPVGTGVVIDSETVLTSDTIVPTGAHVSEFQVVTRGAGCIMQVYGLASLIEHPDFCMENRSTVAFTTAGTMSVAPAPLNVVPNRTGNAVMISANGTCLEAADVTVGGPVSDPNPPCLPGEMLHFTYSSTSAGNPGSPIFMESGGCWELVGIQAGANALDVEAIRDYILSIAANVDPGATWCSGPSCQPPPPVDPCPTCGAATQQINEALTAGIVGPLTGDDWHWQITADTPGDFDDSPVVTVPGVTPGNPADDVYPPGTPDGVWNEFDAAQRWADSINGHFTGAGCDTSSVTGSIWATVSDQGGTAFLSVSSQCGFTLLVSDPGDPTPDCDVGSLFPPCSFNPTAEAFPGSGTDCNRNGTDDFFDTTYGLSPDTNFNAIPDECEGLEVVPVGVPVQAFGGTIVTTNAEGEMVAFGFDPDGQSGYTVDLGATQGWEGTYEGPLVAADLPTGLVFEDEVIGIVDGTPDQTIMTMRVDDVGNMLEITFEPNTPTYGINVYDGEALVASLSAQTGPAYRLAQTSAVDRGGYITWIDDQNIRRCHFQSAQIIPIEIASTSQLVNGDRIELTAENATGSVESVRRIRRRIRRDENGVEICQRMALQQFERPHTAIGPASIAGEAGNRLIISDIGSSGEEYGVRLHPSYSSPVLTQPIAITLQPVDVYGGVNRTFGYHVRGQVTGQGVGTVGTVTARQVVNGPPCTGWRCIEFTEGVGGFGLFPDETGTLEVWRDGEYVGPLQYSGSGPCVWVWCENPIVGVWLDPPPPNGERVQLSVQFDEAVPMATEGSGGASGPTEGTAPLQGDEIRFVFENVTALEAITDLELFANEIDSFVITGETVETRCPADFDGSGDVGFSDLTALLGAWGPCGAGPCPADLDGDGSVAFADLTTLLGVWGPCS